MRTGYSDFLASRYLKSLSKGEAGGDEHGAPDLANGVLSELLEQRSSLPEALWDGEQLRPEVRRHLLTVAQKFHEALGVRAEPVDIRLTGSMANYNWTPKSDIDLHPVYNLREIDDDTELVRELLQAKRALWNDAHTPVVRGHEVELYPQDADEPHYAKGVYSLLDDEWVKKPRRRRGEVDRRAVSEKAAAIMHEIDTSDDCDDCLARLERIKEKIRKMRQCGLERAGEYSVENLAFKVLRNNGYLKKLSEAIKRERDQALSLKVESGGEVAKAGTSEGAKRGWKTRKGELAPVEETPGGTKIPKGEEDEPGKPKSGKIALDWLSQAAAPGEEPDVPGAKKIALDWLQESAPAEADAGAAADLVEDAAEVAVGEEKPPAEERKKIALDWLESVGKEPTPEAVDEAEEAVAGVLDEAGVEGHEEAREEAPEDAPDEAAKKAEPLSLDDLKKIGGQLGSNPGGVYEHKETGERFYVKIPKTDAHARNEALAANLYRLAGVEVPEVQLVDVDGQQGVASKMVEGLAQGSKHTDWDKVQGAQEGLAVDAWLANWDVVGLNFDNLHVAPDGSAVRVDTGGALQFRAQGAPKGAKFGDTVGELETLRDASLNPQAAAVFGQASDEDLEAGVRRVLGVSDAQIDEAVKEFGPADPGEAKELARKLKARRDDLGSKFPHLKGEKKKEPEDEPKGEPASEAEIKDLKSSLESFDQGIMSDAGAALGALESFPTFDPWGNSSEIYEEMNAARERASALVQSGKVSSADAAAAAEALADAEEKGKKITEMYQQEIDLAVDKVEREGEKVRALRKVAEAAKAQKYYLHRIGSLALSAEVAVSNLKNVRDIESLKNAPSWRLKTVRSSYAGAMGRGEKHYNNKSLSERAYHSLKSGLEKKIGQPVVNQLNSAQLALDNPKVDAKVKAAKDAVDNAYSDIQKLSSDPEKYGVTAESVVDSTLKAKKAVAAAKSAVTRAKKKKKNISSLPPIKETGAARVVDEKIAQQLSATRGLAKEHILSEFDGDLNKVRSATKNQYERIDYMQSFVRKALKEYGPPAPGLDPVDPEKAADRVSTVYGDWSGSANGDDALNWRHAALQAYGRSVEDEYTGKAKASGGKRKILESGSPYARASMIAAKPWAEEVWRAWNGNGPKMIWRGVKNIPGESEIKAALDSVGEANLTINSLSSWSERSAEASSWGSGGIVIHQEITPDRVWGYYRAHEMHSDKEAEVVVGHPKPKVRVRLLYVKGYGHAKTYHVEVISLEPPEEKAWAPGDRLPTIIADYGDNADWLHAKVRGHYTPMDEPLPGDEDDEVTPWDEWDEADAEDEE